MIIADGHSSILNTMQADHFKNVYQSHPMVGVFGNKKFLNYFIRVYVLYYISLQFKMQYKMDVLCLHVF